MTTEATPRSIEFGPPEQVESPLGLIMFAWRRKWIVILMAIIGLGLGYLYFLRETPVYRSTAQILLVRSSAKLPIEGLQVDTGYDSTHEILIRSPMVVKLAMDKHDLKSLPTLSNNSSPVGAVMSGLTVVTESQNRNSGDDILQLSYSSLSQNDCPKVLDAIIRAYQEFLGATYENVSQEAIDLIIQAKDELDKQITETQKEYDEFLAASPPLPVAEDGLLSQIKTVRSSAVVANSQTKAKLEHIEAAIKRGGSREALYLTVGHLYEGAGSTTASTSVEDRIFPMLMEEQVLLDRFGQDHPKVQDLRRRIDLTKQHLLGLATRSDVASSGSPRDFFEVYLESLREQLKMNEQTIAEMDELFARESEAAKAFAGARRKEENFQELIASKRSFYNAIVKRLEEISLVKDTNSVRVQLIHPPSLAAQIKPDLQRIMASAGVLGMLAGLALAFVIDRADRRFRSPDEIRTDLGLPVVGHIPVIPVPEKSKKEQAAQGNERELSPVLRVLHHPRGRIAEAYRAVRTALYFSTRGTGHQVIQITSPSPGDGKTTLAGNLAVSIALSGKKTLLLDADFRRARCHRLFAIENGKGVTDILTGNAEFPDVVIDSGVSNLYLLTCGTRPENPSELLTSPRFEELLAMLREKFDFVILDTPPVLAVTDPLNVVPRVDGLLLVMRLTKNARAGSRRALAALEEMGANMLGVVVNGIGGGQGYGSYGKYGYGNYGNGYSYGYSYDRYGYGDQYDYRYGYGYTETDDKSYYEEADDNHNGTRVDKLKTKAKSNGKH